MHSNEQLAWRRFLCRRDRASGFVSVSIQLGRIIRIFCYRYYVPARFSFNEHENWEMKNILDRYIRYIFNEHNKSQFNQINLINLINDYLIGVENTILLYNFKYVVVRFRWEHIPLNFTKIHTPTTYIRTVNGRSISIDANKARNDNYQLCKIKCKNASASFVTENGKT